MDNMAYVLFLVTAILAVIVFGINKWRMSNEIALYVISLSIAIIPEGLIAVVRNYKKKKINSITKF